MTDEHDTKCGAKVRSDSIGAVQWSRALWVELCGGAGGGQSLLVAVGVNREAAVAAAPVVAVGRQTEETAETGVRAHC